MVSAAAAVVTGPVRMERRTPVADAEALVSPDAVHSVLWVPPVPPARAEPRATFPAGFHPLAA